MHFHYSRVCSKRFLISPKSADVKDKGPLIKDKKVLKHRPKRCSTSWFYALMKAQNQEVEQGFKNAPWVFNGWILA